MTIVRTQSGQVLAGVISDDQVVSSTIPVDLSTNTPARIMRVVVEPTVAGDVLDITGEIRVTNDLGYTVGVGLHLRWYDLDDGVPWPHAQPWTQIKTPTGDNVFSPRHHMPLTMSRLYQVPAAWEAGHRMTVNLLADAHSTAWKTGDKLTVDAYGELIVRRWTQGG